MVTLPPPTPIAHSSFDPGCSRVASHKDQQPPAATPAPTRAPRHEEKQPPGQQANTPARAPPTRSGPQRRCKRHDCSFLHLPTHHLTELRITRQATHTLAGSTINIVGSHPQRPP